MAAKSRLARREPAHSLCKACRHTRVCALRHGTRTPITECTEYDDPGDSLRAAPAAATATVTRPSIRAAALNAVKGLCRTCENNQTCTFTSPAGGVWRCEEYR